MMFSALCTLGAAAGAQAQSRDDDYVEPADPSADAPQSDPDGPAAPMQSRRPAPPSEPSSGSSDKWARWSKRYIDRPRTLPAGMIEAGGYLDFSRLGGDPSVTTTSLFAAAAYGVSDQLEVRASYGIALDEFEAKGPFSAGAAFGLMEGALAVAVAGDFVYDLNSEVGEIGVGARARYLVSPKLSIYSQRQLVVTVISDFDLKPANLRLPVGVGFQLNDQLYLFGETELAVLDLKDSETLALFADYIPITAGAVFSLSKKLEVGGLLYTDLKNDAFDTMLIEGFARAYF